MILFDTRGFIVVVVVMAVAVVISTTTIHCSTSDDFNHQSLLRNVDNDNKLTVSVDNSTTTSEVVIATSTSLDTIPSGAWYFGDLTLYEPKSNGGGCLSTSYPFIQMKSNGVAIVISVFGQSLINIDTIAKRPFGSMLFEGIMTYKGQSAPVCFSLKNGIEFSITSTTDFLTCGSLGSNNEAPTCSGLDSHRIVYSSPGLITSLVNAGIIVGIVMVVLCCLICCICCCVCIARSRRRRRNRKNTRHLASMNETLLVNQPLGSYVPNSY